MSGWDGRGSTRAWRRARAITLLANQLATGGACQLALPGQWVTRDGHVRSCTGIADCVHHPRGKGAGDGPDNRVAACTPCNLRVGDPTKAPDPPGRSATRWE